MLSQSAAGKDLHSPSDPGQSSPHRALVEASDIPVLAFSHRFTRDEHVAEHHHSRSQLLHPITGVVIVTTPAGRWMVPPDHALWIPAGLRHAVEAIGGVAMQSAYVRLDAINGLPAHLHVTGMTRLMRSLPDSVSQPGVSRLASWRRSPA